MPLMPLELQINLLPVSGKKIPKFAKIYQFLCYISQFDFRLENVWPIGPFHNVLLLFFSDVLFLLRAEPAGSLEVNVLFSFINS